MPPDLIEDADINHTARDEGINTCTESLRDTVETHGDVFLTESTLVEAPESLEVVEPRGELEDEVSSFNSADLGLFSSCECQTEQSTALIEELIVKKPGSEHERKPKKPLIEVLSSSEAPLQDNTEPGMEATVEATGGIEELTEKTSEGDIRWAFSADKSKQLELSVGVKSHNGGLLIEEVDSEEETNSSKSGGQQTVEDRVWQLASKVGSTLESDRVELDHQMKEKLHKRLDDAGLLDKVSLAF